MCVCVWPCRFVRNISTSKEGWIAAANLITLIGKSKSCQSLTSSGMQTSYPKRRAWHTDTPPCLTPIHNVCVCVFLTEGSGNLSTSSSCSETYTSFSDIKPWAPPALPRITWLSVLYRQQHHHRVFCQVSTESCIFKVTHMHQLLIRHTCAHVLDIWLCSADTGVRSPSQYIVTWSSSSHTLVCIFLWRAEDTCDYNVIDVWMGQRDWSQSMHLFVWMTAVFVFVCTNSSQEFLTPLLL